MASQKVVAMPEAGRRERKRNQTRDRLISVAMGLFAKRGILATTIEEITEAADVAKGTFFNYFTSKEEILLVFGQRMRAGMAPRIQKAMEEQRPVADTVREAVRQLLTVTHPGPGLMKSMLSSLLSNGKVLEIWLSEEKHVLELVAKLFRYGQQRGEIRSDLQADEIALRLRQTLLGALLFWVLHQPSKAGEWVTPSLDLFLEAVAERRQL